MSASLKDNGPNDSDNNGDEVDYQAPGLNGGRSRGPNVVHSNAHFVVNFGVIIMIACVVGLLLLCCTGCGPIKTDHKRQTKVAASAVADDTQGAKKTINIVYDLPEATRKPFETMIGTYGAITAQANIISATSKPDQAMVKRCYNNVDDVNALRTTLKKQLSVHDFKAANTASGGSQLVPDKLSHEDCKHPIK